MRKWYRVIWWIIFVEFLVLYLLNKSSVQVHSIFGRAVGVLFCTMPIQAMLYLKSKDHCVAKNKRVLYGIGFWFISLTYVMSVVAAMVGVLE